MNKVVIEITDKGWTKKVLINGKEFNEDWKLTYFGGKNVGQDLEEVEEIPEGLWESLRDNDPYEIANALKNL